jgi:hypothetical protein
VHVYRAGLRDVVAYVDARSDLFARDRASTPTLPPREAREAVWAAWQRFLDYVLALDTIGRYHQRFAELAPPDREHSFAIGHAAFVSASAPTDRDRTPPRDRSSLVRSLPTALGAIWIVCGRAYE